MPKSVSGTRYALCVSNEGLPVALERRKVYRAVADPAARPLGLIRVIDESGEDYLYPEELFVPISLPGPARKALARSS